MKEREQDGGHEASEVMKASISPSGGERYGNWICLRKWAIRLITSG